MATETDVYAQRTPLFTGDDEIINPVILANKLSLLSDEPFIDLLTYETFPSSFTRAVRKVSRQLEKENPDYHPHGLPKLYSGSKTWNCYPIFWLRNQNIDLDSCWWGIYTEMGWSYNNNPTAFNDEYWHKDLNDESNIPGENFTKLSERSAIRSAIDSAKTPQDAVPYEANNTDWFKAHPEFVQTDSILRNFGIDLKKSIIDPLREDPNQEDIDHNLFGFLSSIVPQTGDEAEYLYRFFREIFADSAFTGTIPKLESACVQKSLKSAGFYSSEGENVGWINNVSGDLSAQKSANYYYQYSAENDTGFDARKVYRFVDPKNQMSLELDCDDIIIRKIKGTIDNKRHNEMEVVVGKGEPFPEFTHFHKAVYPINPNNGTDGFTVAQVEEYDVSVMDIHEYALTKTDLPEKDPKAWIAYRVQKDFRTHSARHKWDTENSTDLNHAAGGQYIEEIILINPRVEYRGVYGTDFKSKRAYLALHGNSYTKELDYPTILKFNTSAQMYVNKTIGSTFPGDTGESDAIVVPTVEFIVDDMLLKRRENVIARSMSVLSIAIVRTSSSWMDDVFKVVMIIAIVVLVILPGGQALASELASITTLTELITFIVVKYITFKGIEFISDELIRILVDEFGFEVGAQIVALIAAVATFKGLSSDSTRSVELFMSLAANFDDSYVKLTNLEIQSGLEELEAFQELTTKKLEELNEISDNLLGSSDPNLSLATMVFLLQDESPDEFFNRTIEDKNPGIKAIEQLESEISRFKLLDHTKPPIIAAEESTNEEYLDQLI